MEIPSELVKREAQSFLSFVAEAETDRAIDARTFHVTGRYSDTDFQHLAELIQDAGTHASIAFLGRDADERADTITALDNAGHEIVLHGHRHLECSNLSYDVAHDNLNQGLNALESAANVTPRGFFAPFKTVSQGTLDAAADLELEWVLGATNATVPDTLTVIDPVYPHDSRLLEDGMSPVDTFDQLRDAASPGSTYLFHPNLLEYYGASAEFETWLRDVQPRPISDAGPDDISAVLDCLRPITIK